MRVQTANEQVYIKASMETIGRTRIDDPQISLLEAEIGGLNLELEREKKKSRVERVEGSKHLQELQDTQRNLLRCQKSLQESKKSLAAAQAEVRDKNLAFVNAEEELVRCRQQVRDLEQQIQQSAGHNQHEAQRHVVMANGSASELGESQQQHALHTSLNPQEASSFDELYEVLQESLEEQNQLRLQNQAQTDEIQTLKSELQISHNDAANKKKEMDILRNYIRGSEQRNSKKERAGLEIETEMEKNLKLKDSIICRYATQIEELERKVKRIPQLASQISQLESVNATLRSTYQQKKKKMEDDGAKLEVAMMALENKLFAMESRYERRLAEARASKDVS